MYFNSQSSFYQQRYSQLIAYIDYAFITSLVVMRLPCGERKMSKEMTRLRAFVLTPTSAVPSHLAIHNRFTCLIKACDISIELGSKIPEKSRLLAYKYLFIDLDECQEENGLPENIAALAASNTTILFNATNGLTCEKTALLSSVKGVFYKHDRPDIIIKGLDCIIRQEFWFKRSTMSSAIIYLLQATTNKQIQTIDEHNDIIFTTLTKRQKMIACLVARGAQNKEIADQLHISTNTVKTHLYSIFRKTSSRNRIELISRTQNYISAVN